MLTPSKKHVDSQFQTPSPIHFQSSLKPKAPNIVNKENDIAFRQRNSNYDLIPDETSMGEFVWKKKEKRDLKRKRQNPNTGRKRNLIEERRTELEQLKIRRLERDEIYAQRMKEREDFKKLKLAGEFENWEMEEHEFMLRQAKEKSKLRLKAGRPQPIDLLVQCKENEELCLVANYPLNVIARLSKSELGDLAEDVKVYKEIEGESECFYWKDVLNIVQKYLGDSTSDLDSSRRRGINQAVSPDVNKILSGKTSNQLLILRGQIQEKLASGNIDVSFWECLLDNLNFYLSFARLNEMQEQMSLRRVQRSQQNYSGGGTKTGVKNMKIVHLEQSENCHLTENPRQISESTHTSLPEDIKLDSTLQYRTVCETNQTGIHQHQQVSESITSHYIQRDIDISETQYSPKYLKESELDKDIIITEPVEDMEKLTLARQQVHERYKQNHLSNHDSDSDDESDFTKEYTLLHRSYSWDSIYRPRKPRYFNRVIAMIVWNRYNRTHYDTDNPPPKTVRGYKFNIFYPDLIDKTISPVYSITPCVENKELDIIKFIAGPPYEDIAFQIVHGEWNKSVKRGYRCSFNGRVLELYFHFKHTCYRR